MTVGEAFEEPVGTREAIMKATYDALCTHGYADLTIQRIGDEFPKSTSLVYHHYDGKDELLLEFLEYMLDHFETSVPREEYDDARAQLRAVLDHVLPDELEPRRDDFTRSMVELRSQAAHDPAYRAYFTRHGEFFHDRLTAIIERGIEEGVFRDVEPAPVAGFLLTAIEGAMLRRVTTDIEEAIPELRAELETYIDCRLLAMTTATE